MPGVLARLSVAAVLVTAVAHCAPLVPATYDAAVTIPGATAHQIGSSTQDVRLASPPDPYSRSAAEAIAGPNELRVYAFAAGTPDMSNSGGGNAESFAYFGDTLAISGPTAGFLDVVVDVEGSSDATAFFHISAGLADQCSGTVPFYVTIIDCGTLRAGPNNRFHLPYTLDSDGTTYFEGQFQATAACFLPAWVGNISCSSEVDYLQTRVASITVDDADGNPVRGATVTSLAGVDYSLTQQSAVTPEPSSLALLGTGSACVIGAVRKRRAR